MELDRDIAVAVAAALGEEENSGALDGWEMLAATGVRGLRLLHETRTFRTMLFTERNAAALSVLARNVAEYSGEGARFAGHDARTRVGGESFDFVDLDPFGTPVPFVEAALKSVKAGGVLGVAATDMAVLAGAMPSACRNRYAAEPLRGRLGPEGGLRILLAHLANAAERLGRSVHPLLAYVLGHHVRAYLKVGARDSSTSLEIGTIREGRWKGPPVPSGISFGPMWLGALFDSGFVRRLKRPATAARPREAENFIDRIRSEADVHAPLAYEPNELARRLHLAEPPALDALLRGLVGAGFSAARSHVQPAAFRTVAPREIVESVARATALSSR